MLIYNYVKTGDGISLFTVSKTQLTTNILVFALYNGTKAIADRVINKAKALGLISSNRGLVSRYSGSTHFATNAEILSLNHTQIQLFEQKKEQQQISKLAEELLKLNKKNKPLKEVELKFPNNLDTDQIYDLLLELELAGRLKIQKIKLKTFYTFN